MARHVLTRHVQCVEHVETSTLSRAVRQAQHRQNAWTRHVECVVLRCVVEFGRKCLSKNISYRVRVVVCSPPQYSIVNTVIYSILSSFHWS